MSDDFYHDDPIEEKTTRKFRNNLLTPFALIIASVFFFQSTLAGNITLSSGSGIEFGQGISQTVACSGSNNLMVTPYSSFVNSANSGGTYNFSSITVSGIPDSCNGAQFQINAYGNSSQSPLALYNSTSANVIVADTGESFRLDIGALGITLTVNSSSSFTVTFGTPVATSDAVFKLTIQSTTKSTQTTYSVGDTGPGGGIVFYYLAAGFNCGANYTETGSPTLAKCKYLEVAPSDWGSINDRSNMPWANVQTDIAGIPNEVGSSNNSFALIGLGYKYSEYIVAQNGSPYNSSTNRYAAGNARAYSGGGLNDWYLPSSAEQNTLCQWNRGITQSFETMCGSSGTVNSATFGAETSGFSNTLLYWASSENDNLGKVTNWGVNQAGHTKTLNAYVRPIRAF